MNNTVIRVEEMAIASLKGCVYGFAEDCVGSPDDIPGMVRSALNGARPDLDAASAEMNNAANEINEGHEYESSDSIRTDDRANLFVNVAGYMLRNDTSGMSDTEIVDAAIVDSYSDNGENECEADDCGGHVTARPGEARGTRTFTGPDDITWRHMWTDDDDHDPVITEAGQVAALIRRVREWSD